MKLDINLRKLLKTLPFSPSFFLFLPVSCPPKRRCRTAVFRFTSKHQPSFFKTGDGRGVKNNRGVPECQKVHLSAFYFHLYFFHFYFCYITAGANTFKNIYFLVSFHWKLSQHFLLSGIRCNHWILNFQSELLSSLRWRG